MIQHIELSSSDEIMCLFGFRLGTNIYLHFILDKINSNMYLKVSASQTIFVLAHSLIH